MITYRKQDITTVASGIIIHGCNCQGVIGAGVAAALRKKFPEIFPKYKKMCDEFENSKELLGMSCFIHVATEFETGNPLYVGNLFTQHTYGRNGLKYADLEAIATSVGFTFEMAKEWDLPVYMPKIGCGLGGLDWETEVRPVIEKLDETYQVQVFVCEI